MEDTSQVQPAKETSFSTTLYPFRHQVGGHTQLMLLDSSTICKPLIERELFFYLNIPQELQQFVPNYKGVVQVSQVDGYPLLYHPIKDLKSSKNTNAQAKNKDQVYSRPELRVKLLNCNGRRLLQKEVSTENKKPIKYSSQPSQFYFLLLENITSNYHQPCILDLKMGTRQHGEDASDEKKSRQMAKCAASTSASLGVRLGGMQLFNVKINEFTFKDKYYGRSLTENGFVKALLKFFNNGLELRKNVINQVICKLRELRTSIEKQTCFRFYSTSLLIAYEGCINENCLMCGKKKEFQIDSAFNNCFLYNERKISARKKRKEKSINLDLNENKKTKNQTIKTDCDDKDVDEGFEKDVEEGLLYPIEIEQNNETNDCFNENENSQDEIVDCNVDDEDCSSMDTDDYYHAIGRANKISNKEFMKNCTNSNNLMVTTLINIHNKNKKRKRRKNSFSCDEDSSLDSNTECSTFNCDVNLNNNKNILSSNLPSYLNVHSSESCSSCSSSDLSDNFHHNQQLINSTYCDTFLLSKNNIQNLSTSTTRKNQNCKLFNTKSSMFNKKNQIINHNNPNFIKKSSDKPIVDVRIIDFAHTILKKDDKDHHGPDQGFLFGLDNLLNLLIKAKDKNYNESEL